MREILTLGIYITRVFSFQDTAYRRPQTTSSCSLWRRAEDVRNGEGFYGRIQESALDSSGLCAPELCETQIRAEILHSGRMRSQWWQRGELFLGRRVSKTHRRLAEKEDRHQFIRGRTHGETDSRLWSNPFFQAGPRLLSVGNFHRP